MGLVEDIDPVTSRCRLGGAVDDLLHVVDTAVGGGIEFDHVEGPSLTDGDARVALAARFAVAEVGAVERLGEDAGGGGLAGAAWTAEQVGVPHPVFDDRVAQGRHEVVLAADL